jgi:hypothetical protein
MVTHNFGAMQYVVLLSLLPQCLVRLIVGNVFHWRNFHTIFGENLENNF